MKNAPGARVWIPLALLLAGASPSAVEAAPVAEVRPALVVAASGQAISIAIDVDMTMTGERLGSYGAVLRWNPAHLRYGSDSGGGDPPFDTAVVNRSDVGLGVLRFSDASPLGASGRVNLLNVRFLVVAEPCLTTPLDLRFTSLFSADTFQDLLPLLVVRNGAVNVNDFFFALRASGIVDTFLSWNAIAGAASYDVIRGRERQLLDDGTSIRLGDVVCLEDDSLDTTTGAGSEPANPDFERPLPGEAFFYLVRFFDGVQNRTYGFRPFCTRERVADAGDCP